MPFAFLRGAQVLPSLLWDLPSPVNWPTRLAFQLVPRSSQLALRTADISFLCALPPTLRPQWGQRMTALAKNSPNARLITLQYPLQGTPPPFGPPFSLEESVYRDVLGDWEAVYDEEVPQEMRRQNAPPGNERLVVWKRK